MSYPQNPGQGQNPQQPYGQQPYPGQQLVPGQPFSGPQQVPGQPFAGPQPVPGQPFSGTQPVPGQPFSGAQPVPGQPFPGQQPAPYGQPQPFGQPGQPFAAYPGGPGQLQQKPGGGTAITAAVLAILGGIVAVIGVIGSVVGMAAFHGVFGLLIVSLIVELAMAVLLLWGAISLIMHKPLGRMLVIIGCSVAIAFTVISLIISMAGGVGLGASSEFLGYGIASSLLSLLPPVATLVLAIVKPTKLWVGLDDAAPQYAAGYVQQPGGPQGW
ncbi:hypothetical protein [Amycolatopsis sp. FDAARGOS 1241]|uniref:hypothetical protein n=1 Tax=Amycolatopsis sp. FDAARGOS 1241 TaxID=2778070 RepID=UPI0019515D26|nr:hypothetical protein [Amycolatopsis sp. FDAARGOS 1241]QRP47173.1 hypothetical protein I6J71_03925 [Amycolatopsis sp. FDAARGOS 1241]